jgi:hypothetical protein
MQNGGVYLHDITPGQSLSGTSNSLHVPDCLYLKARSYELHGTSNRKHWQMDALT